MVIYWKLQHCWSVTHSKLVCLL